jgi:kynurenine formamidase
MTKHLLVPAQPGHVDDGLDPGRDFADPIRAAYEAVSNWGRWGAEDERGALNLITAEHIQRAATTVTVGRVVGCGHIDEMPSVLNTEPPLHHMLSAGDVAGEGCGIATDFIGLAPHGATTTHIDALCHIFFDGQMYNGRPASLVRSNGAEANSIAALADGVMTRGVLLDIPAVRGEQYIEPEEPVTRRDLAAAAEAAGLEIEPGDAVLVRVGRQARRDAQGLETERDGRGNRRIAGLHRDCLPWLHEHGVALLGSDGGNDALPSPKTRERMPIHVGCLVFMGVHLIDNMNLETLRQACRDHGRAEFFFSVAPLTLARATGSPVNPLAVF